jgi:CheY-like chemotaxis protein
MGGRIDLQSEVGVGSCFTLFLPLERIQARRSMTDVDETVAEPTPEGRAGLRVLAAEDNPTNQLVLKTLLQFAGIEVVIVEDGAQAVEAWEREFWDLILMDVQMPVMDGPAAARAIRAREAELGVRRTPIVALTANTMSHQVEGYLAAGMDAHLGKPIEAE